MPDHETQHASIAARREHTEIAYLNNPGPADPANN